MREKLGYLDVSVRDYSGSGEDTSGYAYNRTASGEVSFNFELWPTFYEKEREAALSADSLGARPLGYHTFSARSGWYVPIKSLGAHVPQNWTRNDDAAQWRVFDYEMYAARATAAHFSPSGAILRTAPTATHPTSAQVRVARVAQVPRRPVDAPHLRRLYTTRRLRQPEGRRGGRGGGGAASAVRLGARPLHLKGPIRARAYDRVRLLRDSNRESGPRPPLIPLSSRRTGTTTAAPRPTCSCRRRWCATTPSFRRRRSGITHSRS